MTPTEQSIERCRGYARHRGWRPARYAKEAGLHPNTLRDFLKSEWNPATNTLVALETIIPTDFAVDAADCLPGGAERPAPANQGAVEGSAVKTLVGNGTKAAPS